MLEKRLSSSDEYASMTESPEVKMCPQSKREDGKHGWVFDGDDPYIICAFCDEMRDALTDRVIRPAR